MNHDIVVRGNNLSVAWARTLVAVADEPDHKAIHVITRISEPTVEDPTIRGLADAMLTNEGLPPISTVANTLFPFAMAQQTPDPVDLATRYLQALPTIRRLHHSNRRGTYFERLVNFPAPDGRRINQVAEIIRRINQERSYRGGKTARYEVGIEHFAEAVPVQEPSRDTNPMDFPCLSLLSFQLDHRDTLHVVAHYRSHFLTQRAYGNYLAIGRLLAYICGHSNVAPGAMTVVAAYATVDGYKKKHIDTIRPYAVGADSLI